MNRDANDSTQARTWTEYLRWAALFAGAAFVFASQEYMARTWRGGPHGFRPITLEHAIGWTAWAILTPLVVVPLVKRFPLTERGKWPRDLAVHLPAAVVLAIAQMGIVAFTTATVYYGISPLATRDIFVDRTVRTFALDTLIYALLVAVVRARGLAAETRRRAMEAATLEARAARAELIVLYGQLQPHFLFNALNGIAELTHTDPARAAHMIRSLGELLRGSIEGAGNLTTTLRAEVEFLRRYVELQQMRFSHFEFELRVDPQAMNAVVPPLLMQPLIENAIRHTVGRSGSGKASLSVDRRRDRLSIVVADNGPGFGSSEPSGTGIGLSTTRERLDRIFGKEYRLELSRDGSSGAVVSIDIPYLAHDLAQV